MDHTTFLRSLSADTKARLTERSDAMGLWHLALYAGALAFCTTILVLRPPFWGLALLPQGLLIVFLFTLSHECTHQTPFRSRWLNEVVGHAAAPLIALPFLWFRYFHLAHHRYTNDPKRDPELADGPRPETWRAYLFYLSGWGYWSAMARVLWRNARGQFDAPYLPPSRHAAMRIEARLILALYALAALSLLVSPLLFWIWILPALIAQPFLRLYLLAEHGRCPPVANMLENTRTTFTNSLVRFLAWNMPYHIEHHSYPAVPFHRLPSLHHEMQAHLRQTAPGYIAFTKSYVQALDR